MSVKSITGICCLYVFLCFPCREVAAQASFGWSAVGSPQPVNQPFPVTISARQANGQIDSTFQSFAQLSGLISSTRSVGQGTTTSSFPLYTYYEDARTQVIYRNDELGGAGRIAGLALDVTSLPGQTLNNWTIRMKHTSLNGFTVASLEGPASGWTTVFQGTTNISSTGWTWFYFQTPFDFDGTRNLMIDFSFNNTSWTSWGLVRTTSASSRTVYAYSDSVHADPLNWSGATQPIAVLGNFFPNLRLLIEDPVSISPSQTGSFTNGVWSGLITVTAPALDMQLRALTGSIRSDSNDFDVRDGSIVAPLPPQSLAITATNAFGFAATWAEVDEALSYRLEISTRSDFSLPPEENPNNYVVNFEGSGETKTGYASGSVALSGLSWTMVEAMIGADANDFKNGARSARLRGYGTSEMRMNSDLTAGIGTISFKYRRYGTDSQRAWRVEYSTDGGSTWLQTGSDFTAPADDVVRSYLANVNVPNSARIRIRTVTSSGSTNQRLNIDDIAISPFGASAVSLFDDYTVLNNQLNTDTLDPETTYYVRVRAANEGGVSSPSPTESVTTLSTTDGFALVSFGAARYIGEEGGADVLIPVSISEPTNATIQIAITGTAQPNGIDFSLSSTTLVFSASGPTQQVLTASMVDDQLAEGPETARLQLVVPPGIMPGEFGATTLTIRDNDAFSIVAANITSGGRQEYEEPGERIFQALSPDIALIQEAKLPDAGFVNRQWVDQHFGEQFHFHIGSGSLPTAIISRWPILESGNWTASNISNRDYSWATIDLPGSRKLHAISVHLLTTSTGAREDSARALTNYIAQASWSSNDFWVIGGDFNTASRTESAIQVMTTVFTDQRIPADQNGVRNTNAGRTAPYDYVLPNPTLNAQHVPFSLWGYTFTNGMVFDTRLIWPLGVPSPALATDSDEVGMQHMAVMKVFELENVLLPPSSFMASPLDSERIQLDWTLNAGNDEIVVAWNTTGTFTSPSGQPPVAGQSFAGGTVLYRGTGNSLTHTSLTSCTLYHYRIWSYQNGEYSPGLQTSAETEGLLAPDTPTATSLSPESFQLNWSVVSGATGFIAQVSTAPGFVLANSLVEPYTVDFEDATKGGFAPGDVTLNGLSWNLNQALIGNLADDRFNGQFSARVRSNETVQAGIMTMNEDYEGGLSAIVFYHARYGSNSGTSGRVDYSTDGGGTWTAAGSFDVTSTDLTLFTVTNLTIQTPARIRIVKTSGTTERYNIDDITLYPYAMANSFINGYSNRLASTASLVVTGLTAETTYYFRVRAIGSDCESDYSTVGHFTTIATPQATTNAPVAVPYAWVDAFYGVGADYNAVVTNTTASGMTVWQAYVAGLDPTDSNSVFAGDANNNAADSSGSPTLRWPYAEGRVYSVIWSDDPLGTGMNWVTNLLSSGDFSQSNGTATWTDTNILNGVGRFYRIKVRLED